MRRALFIVILVLAITLVSAQLGAPVKDKFFDGKVDNSGTVDVKGMPYWIRLSSDLSRITVKPGNQSAFLVDLGACKIKDNVDICYKNNSVAGHNYTLDKEFYAADISISLFKAFMYLDHVLGNTSIIPGQAIDYTIKIDSNGFQPPKDVIYREYINKDIFNIETVNGECKRKEDEIYFNDSVGSAKSIDCDVRLRAKANGTTSINANLTYFDGFEHKVIPYTNAVTVSKPDIVVSHKVSKDLKVGTVGRFDVFVNNTAQETISILELSYLFPEAVTVGKHSPAFNEFGGKTILSWKGSIEGQQPQQFFSEFLITKVKSEPIKMLVRYKVRGFLARVEDEIPVDIEKPELIISWGDSNYPLREGEVYNASLQIFNPASDQAIEGVHVKITSSLPSLNSDKEIGNLVQLQKLMVADLAGPWPLLENDHWVRIDVTYKSHYDETFTTSERHVIKVLPKDVIIPVEENVANATVVEPVVQQTIVDEESDKPSRSKIPLFFFGLAFALLIILFIGKKSGRYRYYGKMERMMKQQMEEVKREKKLGFYSKFRKKREEKIDTNVTFDDWKSKFYKQHPAFLPAKDQLRVALGGEPAKKEQSQMPKAELKPSAEPIKVDEREDHIKKIHDLLTAADNHVAKGNHKHAAAAYNEAKTHFMAHHHKLAVEHKQKLHGRFKDVFEKITKARAQPDAKQSQVTEQSPKQPDSKEQLPIKEEKKPEQPIKEVKPKKKDDNDDLLPPPDLT